MRRIFHEMLMDGQLTYRPVDCDSMKGHHLIIFHRSSVDIG